MISIPSKNATLFFVLSAILLGALDFVQADEASSFSDEDRTYWAFQPIRRPRAPTVKNRRWLRNPIDGFVLEQLERKGLTPAREADRRTLIRRACFDLHGLPPSSEQIDQFLNDHKPGAFDRVIERLLASPRYGERWARHWLDLVRYAETDGYNQDALRPDAWRYRDYVIRALNDDKPYNRFVAEQVAGDEIAPDDYEALVATGFLRHGPYEFNQRDAPQQRMHILNDVTDVTGQVFLGLTIRCARCHDHKFDAILQQDYFRLQAFFTPLISRDDAWFADASQRQDYRRKQSDWEKSTQTIRVEIAGIEAPYRRRERRLRKELFTKEIQAIIEKSPDQRTPLEKQIGGLAEKQLILTTADIQKKIKGEERKRWEALRKKLAEFDSMRPSPLPRIMAVQDVGPEAPPTIVPNLGDVHDPATHVAPGFLTILNGSPAQVKHMSRSTGRRTVLANWLASKKNPLVARVMVNRLWHHHFRRGLVSTPNDLGRQGAACTHPELLDWLASEFMAKEWSLKAMHRIMMTSAAYRQASLVTASKRAKVVDPDNLLIWRMRSGRLEAEAIRDSMLAASGELNLKMAGVSVYPQLPKGISVRHAWTATADAAERNRRSVYLFVKRNLQHPLLDAFDMPDTHESCARRQITTTAPQALILLNGKWSLDRASAFAGRLIEIHAGRRRSGAIIGQAYQWAYARPASALEISQGTAFWDEQTAVIARRLNAKKPVRSPANVPVSWTKARGAALVDFCHALLNSNEFIYVD